MLTDAQKRARAKYDKKCRRYVITAYLSDTDIKEKLDSEESYNGYIKRLIREDIARTK